MKKTANYLDRKMASRLSPNMRGYLLHLSFMQKNPGKSTEDSPYKNKFTRAAIKPLKLRNLIEGRTVTDRGQKIVDILLEDTQDE